MKESEKAPAPEFNPDYIARNQIPGSLKEVAELIGELHEAIGKLSERRQKGLPQLREKLEAALHAHNLAKLGYPIDGTLIISSNVVMVAEQVSLALTSIRLASIVEAPAVIDDLCEKVARLVGKEIPPLR